jgi:glycosidase
MIKTLMMKPANIHLFLAMMLFPFFQSGQAQAASEGGIPPVWTANAIWYQIFVERFSNGDPKNDPTSSDIDILPTGMKVPAGWAVTPWTQDWYTAEPWAKATGKSFGEMAQYRRYGGDLQGVLNKLDYLESLGITALYLNPLNDAPSLHKYDARFYHHIDVNFGPDPAGDKKIIASEKWNDPKTWKWTSADKLFLKLVAECRKRGIRIILDYSWNHTGVLFPAWQDILKHQEKSEFKDWYEISRWDDPKTLKNEFEYTGWAGVNTLPELKKTGITGTRKSGYPYEGNIAEAVKQHIFDVTARWLAPDGDPGKGIDGYRLDVADQIGLGFWRDYRQFVKKLKPEACLIGEIWWAEWPEKLMDPVPYLQGDVFDAVMFYQIYKPARYFFASTKTPFSAKQFRDSVEFQWNRLAKPCRYAMMNTASSHDAPRLLTDFYNPNRYKYHANPVDDSTYKTGKPDGETYRRLQMYLCWAFTTVGAPHIWNGEEMGMWGADDPHCRKPLWWKELSFEPETRRNFQKGDSAKDPVGFNARQFIWYKKLIKIRRDNPVLSTGEFEFVLSEGNKLVYRRYDDKSEIMVFFNMENKEHMFSLPDGASGKELLSGKVITTKLMPVSPRSCAILKIK